MVPTFYGSSTIFGDKRLRVLSRIPQMDQSLENRIRERAYEIWTAHGCIDGQADQHWLAAEREILASATNTLDRSRNIVSQREKRRPSPRAKTPKAQERPADAWREVGCNPGTRDVLAAVGVVSVRGFVQPTGRAG